MWGWIISFRPPSAGVSELSSWYSYYILEVWEEMVYWFPMKLALENKHMWIPERFTWWGSLKYKGMFIRIPMWNWKQNPHQDTRHNPSLHLCNSRLISARKVQILDAGSAMDFPRWENPLDEHTLIVRNSSLKQLLALANTRTPL